MILDLLHRIVRRRYRALGLRSTFLDWTSGRLHYMIRDNPTVRGTLVLVHGIGTSSSTWSKTMALIDRDFQIVAPDLPGFGFSKVNDPKGFCTLREHVDALANVIGALRGEPVVLLGHSLGGWVCARYASIHPERVRHLVLVDTAGVYYRGVESLRALFTLNSVHDARRLLNNLWYRYPWYFKPFARSIFHELRRRNMNDLVTSIDVKDLLGEELQQLRMPVTIIWGKEDGVTSPESVNVLRKSIPAATVFFIDRCGHVPQLELPGDFALLVNRILEKESDAVA